MTLSPFDHMNSAKNPLILSKAEDKAKRDKRNAETDLQNKICKWLRDEYPGLIFLSDFAAGLNLTPFLAGIRSAQACDYKVPDLYIFGPVKPLIIEIKVKDDDLFLKDGRTLKNEHVQSQFETIIKLRDTCYADFGVGEIDIRSMIRSYFYDKIIFYKTILPFRQPTLIQKTNSKADDFFNYQR